MAGRRVAGHRESGGKATPTVRKRGRTPQTSARTAPALPMLRNSERSTLKKCEFLWDLTYNRRLKPETEMPALRFGTLVHAALAAYYIPGVKRGPHPARTFEALYEKDLKRTRETFGMKVDEDERWVEAGELGPAMLENYIDEWGSDSQWEVLVTEFPFQTTVMTPGMRAGNTWIEAPEPWFQYVGVVDGVWRNRITKELWIADHKTTDGIGDKKWSHLTLDDQAGGYWSFGVDFLVEAELMRKNQRLHGMLYNLLRKAMPDERQSKLVGGQRTYLNLDGSVSKKQPTPYFARKPVFRDQYDKQEARRRAAIDYKRIELFRSGQLEISKNPGMWTCPSCSMRDVCELHETGADFESFITATTKTWEPYDAHEIYDGR